MSMKFGGGVEDMKPQTLTGPDFFSLSRPVRGSNYLVRNRDPISSSSYPGRVDIVDPLLFTAVTMSARGQQLRVTVSRIPGLIIYEVQSPQNRILHADL